MRHVRAIIVLLAILPVSAIASDAKPQVSEAAKACAGSAFEDYIKANAALLLNAKADPMLSVEDTIAQRRLVEGYCKKWASCIADDMPASARELVYRSQFSKCVDLEAKVKSADE